MRDAAIGGLDLNGPGTYLHWSFIEISLANLIVIAVMVVLFGAALLIRFPHKRGTDLPPAGITEPEPAIAAAAPEQGDERIWTARARVFATRLLAPKKLLPDRQPAYVSSWIYVFGVAALAALGIVIASGLGLALGGSDWWHTNPVGHFFNSLHLWSVELFMAFLVIHLWGKFWMAAWRGRRAMTWITGVLAFLASVVTCFTGYLSQQNELRLPVDRHQRQGRLQRRRRRLVLEPDELRSDVHVAYRADAADPRRSCRRAHSHGAGSRRLPPAAGPAGPRPGSPQGRRGR
jgi:hypothetical protein